MKKLSVSIKGTTALMMHNDTLTDELHPLTKMSKTLTSKKKKTDEDVENIALISWSAGLHYKTGIGYYIPSIAFLASIMNAAKIEKKGTDVKRFVSVKNDGILKFEHNDMLPENLYNIKNTDGTRKYVDRRSAVVNSGKSRVMRTRPFFPEWEADFEIWFDENYFNKDTLMNIIQKAGQIIGLLDMRPRYGLFEITNIKEVK